MMDVESGFFSTIAQVSATLIGFALLVPVFQTRAQSHSISGDKYIKRDKFSMKCLFLVLLPILVLICPFFLSLVLVRYPNLIIPQHYSIISIVCTVFFIRYLLWVKTWSEFTSGSNIIKGILEWAFLGVPIVVFASMQILSIKQISSIFCPYFNDFNFIVYDLVILVIIGLSLILRNLGVEIDKGVFFKKKEISLKFELAEREIAGNINEVVKERERVIKEMDRLLQDTNKSEAELRELKRTSGEYEGEISILEGLMKIIESIYKNIKDNKDDQFCINDFSSFDGWIVDADRRKDAFITGTERAKRVLERVYKIRLDGAMIEDVVISVVVPTYGRVYILKKLLNSLKRAGSNYGSTFEVLIIDNSPSDQREQIEQLCRIFQAKYIPGPSSVREKRNIGIRESKGKIVFFVDSDCIVPREIFIEHLKMYNKPDTAGVLGLTKFFGKNTTMWRIVKRTKFLDAFLFAEKLSNYIDSAPWGTCTNLSIRKDVLDAVSGFDTKFPFKLGGDDTDLGIRINKAGYKIKMNPNAVVYHTKETWNNFLAVARRAFRWGRMDYHLFYEKHKDKISWTFPKPVPLFSFLLLLGFIKAIMNYMLFLSLPFIWLILFLVLNSLLIVKSSRASLKSIVFEIPAQFLHFLFDFGTILESLKSKKLSTFFKSPLDDPRQVIILWDEKVREEWSIIFSSIFIFLFYLYTQ